MVAEGIRTAAAIESVVAENARVSASELAQFEEMMGSPTMRIALASTFGELQALTGGKKELLEAAVPIIFGVMSLCLAVGYRMGRDQEDSK